MPKLPTRLKQGAKTAGVIAISVASGFGTHKAIKHGMDRHIYKSIPKSTVEQISETNSDLIELNKKSRIHEIYFKDTEKINYVNGDRIHKVNIDVSRLNEISNMLPVESRRNINRVIENKIKIVNSEIRRNPKLQKEIINRVGVLDYRIYLLSLPMNKLEKVFTKSELKLIQNEIKKIPTEDLKRLEERLNQSTGYSLLAGFLLSSLMISLGAKKKSIEEFDFH